MLRCSEADRPARLRDFVKVLRAVSEAGFRAVDITSAVLRHLGVDQGMALLEELHLRVACLNSLAPYANAAVPEADFADMVRQDLSLAARLGTGLMMLIPSSAPGTPESLGPVLRRRFSLAAAAAKEFDVTCVFEDDPRLALPMCAGDDLQRMLEAVPELRVVYDTANVLMVHEDPAQVYERFADVTVHMHLKDMGPTDPNHPYSAMSTRGIPYANCPHGKGEVDFRRFIRTARAHGYHGTMAVEYTIDPLAPYEQDFSRLYSMFTNLIREE